MSIDPRWLGSAGAPGFAEILDSLAEAVTIRDADHRIVYANQAALRHLGFASLEDLQRDPPQSIMDEYVVYDEQGHVVEMQDIPSVRLLAGAEAEPLLIRTINRTTGELRWQVLKATPLRGEDGTPVATVMIIEDVTTQKTVELRERFVVRATETLMSSLDYAETLRNVAWLAVPEIADWCAVDLLGEGGARQQVVVAHPDPAKLVLAEKLRGYEPRPGEESTTARVARTGIAELYEQVSDEALVASARDDEHLELLRAVGFRSVLVVPMVARGRTLGVMTLVSAESLRRFDDGDKAFAEQLAGRAALAVDNSRLATSRHEIAVTLQRSLLPDAVPAIEGWQVAAMYRAATGHGEVEVGGDFYDFIRTPDGWLVLLGDVTGRGVQAAAMTSLMRHGARFLARTEHRPSGILACLDEALRQQPELSLCSALCLRLGDGRVVVSSAGHPSPLIVRDDGSIREMGYSGPLLGVWHESEWLDHAVALAADEMMLIYTDGVTDTRGASGRFGITRLREVLRQQAGAQPQELLDRLGAELDRFQVPGQSDDTGAVALRPVAARERETESGDGERVAPAS